MTISASGKRRRAFLMSGVSMIVSPRSRCWTMRSRRTTTGRSRRRGSAAAPSVYKRGRNLLAMRAQLGQALVQDEKLQRLLSEVLGAIAVTAPESVHRFAQELAAGQVVQACAQAFETSGKLLAQPALERRIEAALLAPQEVRRQPLVERFLQKKLRRARVDALFRLREDALHEAMIQEGRARLKAVRHGAKVGLAQDVLGQVIRVVDGHQLVERRSAFRIRFSPIRERLQITAMKEGALRGCHAREAQAVGRTPIHRRFRGELA